jgi:hypothetical protein
MLKSNKITFIFIFFLLYSTLCGQNVVINEVVSSNFTTILDEDGDYPDWIELYNSDTSAINLAGYSMSDDFPNDPGWLFPSITLQPDSFLVLFASGKDRGYLVNHWETIIDLGDIWSYHPATADLPENWYTPELDESAWQTGPSGFGYGDGDDSTQLFITLSFFIKMRFHVEDASHVLTAILDIDYDDAFVAYLNGVEIARDNIGTVGIPPPYDAKADVAKEAKMYSGGSPDRFFIENVNELLISGENVLAIQVHNTDISSSDLTLIPFLTLGMSEIPNNAQGPSPYLRFDTELMHTNFKIDSQGETLTLVNPSQEIVDQIETGYIPTDMSRGRQPDGSASWFLFSEPTPAEPNKGESYTGISTEPQFSHAGGFYPDQIVLDISTDPIGGEIYYTTDGSVPTSENSILYSNSINITSDVNIIRAIAIQEGFLPSKVITYTYFINQNYQLPVVSLSTNPENFFDEEIGIYVKGNEAEDSFPYWGANFWSDCPHSDMRGYGCDNWERPVHIEFFEPNGDPGFSVDAGARIHGHWMRGLPQKSIAIIARNQYGYPEINYKIFPNRSFSQFQGLLLRQSGNDWSSSMIRDGIASILGEQRDLDVMAFRPSILFINGEYWGIHNIREKINEHYVQSHHDIDIENLDLIENSYGTWPVYGTIDAYNEMTNFLNNNDMSLDENYERASELIDIDELINYTTLELYCNNWDWIGGNCKRWYVPGRKWRWILNDLDAAFNQYPEQYHPPEEDLFINHNLPGFTEYQALITNEKFRNRFINSFADQLNTIFKPDYVRNVVDSLKGIIEYEMPAHIERWANTFLPGVNWIGDGINSQMEWELELNRLYDFAEKRESFTWNSIRAQFNLTGYYNIEILGDNNHGFVKLNTISVSEFPWQGKYFQNVPITLYAQSKSGFTFSHWISGTDTFYTNPLILSPSSSFAVEVFFTEKEDINLTDKIVINEINYNSADNFNTEDWIEFYNNSDSLVDLSGWVFKDSDDLHVFVFPENLSLAPRSFLILCRDTTSFLSFFPDVNNYVGNMIFGLSGSGELVRLYDPQNQIIDSLSYDDETPWPTEPDGNGPTLELKDPDSDNSRGENWAASTGHGTPGMKNITQIDEKKIIEDFHVRQNYPNPFNSETTIEYNLAFDSYVKIKIYNIRGQVIKSFTREKQSVGIHKIIWDAKSNEGTDMPSGIYFYRINIFSGSSNIQETNKMILIR